MDIVKATSYGYQCITLCGGIPFFFKKFDIFFKKCALQLSWVTVYHKILPKTAHKQHIMTFCYTLS